MAVVREVALALDEAVRDAGRDLTFMHICGTHEAAIARHGLRSMLPRGLKIVMGPGCPVCITPQGEIDAAIQLADRGCIVATYGDLLRVPGTNASLETSGGDVRVVQGVHKAVEIAEQADRDVVFISVGFETTAPTVAAALANRPPDNFSILCCHRLVPPAMAWLLDQGEATLDGFLLPGHVCVVAGYREYELFSVPQVVAGFEPEEILLGLLMLTKQVIDGRSVVENAYPRAVSREGNPKARGLMEAVFEPVDVEWRGFPVIPRSGLRLRSEFRQYDALEKYGIRIEPTPKKTACICDRVLRGVADPTDCRLFSRACTPRMPIGPCMVSHEGACRIWHQFRIGEDR
jgi:hydrogenase expression/formation protein HypD